MRLLEHITKKSRRLLVAMLLVFALAAFLRLYNIGWSFSNNGVDEGIMLMRARMLSEGFELYSEIPCDQAPLALLMAGALDGDVLASRIMSAVLSIAAIAACMEAAKRARGETAMLVTGLVLAVDFAFLKESRLFSLDGMSAYFLAFSLVPLVAYVRSGSRLMLAAAALLLGLSAASKLYGAVAVLGVLVYMLVEAMAERKRELPARRKLIDGALLIVTSILPMAMLMAMLGPSDMLEGMVFDQGHREFDLVMKLSVPLFFGFTIAYVLPFAYMRFMWMRLPETRVLLVISAALLANFVFQPLAFLHNMVLLSPPLAVLVGLLAAERFEPEKRVIHKENMRDVTENRIRPGQWVPAFILVGIVISAGAAAYGLTVQGKSPQQVYGEKIASWTAEDDWIISGDPLIAAYAERNVPLSMVNMGTRIYPEITLQDVKDALEAHGVEVVVICYRLFEEDMAGLPAYLSELGFEKVTASVLGEWSVAAVDTDANGRTPWVFVSHGIVDRFNLPVEGW